MAHGGHVEDHRQVDGAPGGRHEHRPVEGVEVDEERQRDGAGQGVGDGESDEEDVGGSAHMGLEKDGADERVGDECEKDDDRGQVAVHDQRHVTRVDRQQQYAVADRRQTPAELFAPVPRRRRQLVERPVAVVAQSKPALDSQRAHLGDAGDCRRALWVGETDPRPAGAAGRLHLVCPRHLRRSSINKKPSGQSLRRRLADPNVKLITVANEV